MSAMRPSATATSAATSPEGVNTCPPVMMRSQFLPMRCASPSDASPAHDAAARSEEHTSELQSLMRISYAVFCLKKKKKNNNNHRLHIHNTNTQYKIQYK